MEPKTVKIEIVGQSVYINGFRVAGPKPWGGGAIRESFDAEIGMIQLAIKSGNE